MHGSGFLHASRLRVEDFTSHMSTLLPLLVAPRQSLVSLLAEASPFLEEALFPQPSSAGVVCIECNCVKKTVNEAIHSMAH